MKKLILSICVLSLVSLGASQAGAAKWAGVKGGINMADLTGDDVSNTDMRNAFAGGAFFGWGINEQFGIQIEGLYMSKGAKSKEDLGGGTPEDVTYKFDYIEFPVFLAVRFPAGEKLAFDIFAGPTFGFNVKAEAEARGTTVDFKDETKGFEFGAAFGGGFYYMLDSFSILADVRYGMGATTIVKDVDGQSSDVKNKGIGIMVGVAFPLGSNQ
jgi:hypothetical protein